MRKYKNGFGTANVGSELTTDQVEFGRAMDKYKRENLRPYPTWSEVLGVLKSLGYRRPEPGATEERA